MWVWISAGNRSPLAKEDERSDPSDQAEQTDLAVCIMRLAILGTRYRNPFCRICGLRMAEPPPLADIPASFQRSST